MSANESKLPQGLPAPEQVRKVLKDLRDEMREGFGDSADQEPTWNLLYNDSSVLSVSQCQALSAVLDEYANRTGDTAGIETRLAYWKAKAEEYAGRINALLDEKEQPNSAATEHQRWSRVRAILMDMLTQSIDRPKGYESLSIMAEATTNEVLEYIDALRQPEQANGPVFTERESYQDGSPLIIEITDASGQVHVLRAYGGNGGPYGIGWVYSGPAEKELLDD